MKKNISSFLILLFLALFTNCEDTPSDRSLIDNLMEDFVEAINSQLPAEYEQLYTYLHPDFAGYEDWKSIDPWRDFFSPPIYMGTPTVYEWTEDDGGPGRSGDMIAWGTYNDNSTLTSYSGSVYLYYCIMRKDNELWKIIAFKRSYTGGTSGADYYIPEGETW